MGARHPSARVSAVCSLSATALPPYSQFLAELPRRIGMGARGGRKAAPSRQAARNENTGNIRARNKAFSLWQDRSIVADRRSCPSMLAREAAQTSQNRRYIALDPGILSLKLVAIRSFRKAPGLGSETGNLTHKDAVSRDVPSFEFSRDFSTNCYARRPGGLPLNTEALRLCGSSRSRTRS